MEDNDQAKYANAFAPYKPKRLEPPFRLDDPRFVWVPSYQTDVQKTWAKFGWKPTKR